jgi:hypothetical protein
LHGERDCDAADAETRNQRPDLHAEVGEQHQEGDHPDDHHPDEAQDV